MAGTRASVASRNGVAEPSSAAHQRILAAALADPSDLPIDEDDTEVDDDTLDEEDEEEEEEPRARRRKRRDEAEDDDEEADEDEDDEDDLDATPSNARLRRLLATDDIKLAKRRLVSVYGHWDRVNKLATALEKERDTLAEASDKASEDQWNIYLAASAAAYLLEQRDIIDDRIEKYISDLAAEGKFTAKQIADAAKEHRQRFKKEAADLMRAHVNDLKREREVAEGNSAKHDRAIDEWVDTEIEAAVRESRRDRIRISIRPSEVEKELRDRYGARYNRIEQRDVRLVVRDLQRAHERRARLGEGRERELRRKARDGYPKAPGRGGAPQSHQSRWQAFVDKRISSYELNTKYPDTVAWAQQRGLL